MLMYVFGSKFIFTIRPETTNTELKMFEKSVENVSFRQVVKFLFENVCVEETDVKFGHLVPFYFVEKVGRNTRI